MSKRLKILFYPLDAIGHVSAAIGMAEVLIASGHTVIFAVNDQWKGRLSKYGIEEILFSQDDRPPEDDPAKRWADMFILDCAAKDGSSLYSAINFRKKLPLLAQEIKEMDPKVEQLLKSIVPDIVIVDHLLTIPSIELSGIPWVLVCSCNPLLQLDDEPLPPFSSGLASKGRETECQCFRYSLNEVSLQEWQNWNNYVISRGLPALKRFRYIPHSKWLNIYGFPLEIDYLDIKSLPPKWYRFDNFMRTDKHLAFQIPDQLRGKPGKLIYFSMGSMGGADIDLMKRLVTILSKSRHRFIVSKGPYHEKYELADNMWGQQSVPQIQVLPTVDLVIFHGGNNTMSEAFLYGKPMIVMPLFVDQWDNAQRVQEKGFGIRLDTYRCTEDELLNAIESLLNDKQLNEKLKNISKRIQSDNSIAKLPQLIENLVK